MKRRHRVVGALSVLVWSVCAAWSTSAGAEARLLFRSGFEGGVYLGEMVDGYRPILGTDAESGFSWPITVLGARGSSLHYIQDDDRRAVDSAIHIVTGHDGQPTRALYSVQRQDLGVTQCPYEILNISDGRNDLYIRYWMKLGPLGLHQPDTWRALFEWKSVGYAEGDGFRLIAFIYTDEQGHPYWHWQGDADPQSPVWEIDNTAVPVPIGEWFLTEFYWRWSEGEDGRALWRVNGHVIGDHHGPTTRNGQPIDFIMLTQIYGDANPKSQWVDDIEIWDGIPAAYQ